MANNQLNTYDVGFTIGSGNREDLLDQISMISPHDTPLVTTAPRGEAKHVLHSWLTDALNATSSAGVAEGTDFVTATLGVRSLIQNVTQIFVRPVKVSNSQRAVNPAGVDDEYKYQILKMGREVSRNVETRIFSVSGSCAVGASNSARIMKSLDDFLAINSYARHIAEWGTGVVHVTATASDQSSATNITEDRFNGMLEFLFHQGGSPDVVYASSPGKRQINAFTGPSGTRRNIELASKKIIASIDLYDTEYGPMEITMNRWVRRSDNVAADQTNMSGMLYALERSLVRVAILRPIKHVPLPPTGDATRGFVLGELTLEVLNPSGCARAFGCDNIVP